MIDTTIKLVVPPEKRKEIIQTFKAILGPIRRSKGCLSCNCYVDIEAENNIFFKEEWSTREDLDSHLKSNHFCVLVGAMKLLIQEPVIRVQTVESTAGAEGFKGEIQLSVFVDSAQSITEAGEVARSVKGVTEVNNDLIVK